MCRQMITGTGITLGIFLLSLYEGSSLSCLKPMQPFPTGHSFYCLLQAKRKNTFTCKITQTLFNIHLIPCVATYYQKLKDYCVPRSPERTFYRSTLCHHVRQEELCSQTWTESMLATGEYGSNPTRSQCVYHPPRRAIKVRSN